jgi:hypothetical protein
VVTDSGYGSEENYEMLESHGIEAFVKFSYFHKEQKRSFKNDPFGIQNLFYNQEKDFYVCTMGQRMEKISTSKRISSNGYESTVSIYQAKNCQGCPPEVVHSEQCVIKQRPIGDYKSTIGSMNSKIKQEHYY